jgi:hypothetical protein
MVLPELCYSVRYVEKNMRGTGDPWSLRQTGVYQQTDSKLNKTTWMLLQPSGSVQRRFKEHLELLDNQALSSIPTDPFQYHIIVLTSSLRNWNEYFVELQEKVDDLVSKPPFTNTCPTTMYAETLS